MCKFDRKELQSSKLPIKISLDPSLLDFSRARTPRYYLRCFFIFISFIFATSIMGNVSPPRPRIYFFLTIACTGSQSTAEARSECQGKMASIMFTHRFFIFRTQAAGGTAKSQTKTNEAAKTVICQTCRQTFVRRLCPSYALAPHLTWITSSSLRPDSQRKNPFRILTRFSYSASLRSF